MENCGKPYSLDYEVDASSLKAKTYEFLVQNLKVNASGATGNKILGRSLVFVFEPDGTNTITMDNESYLSITKNISLTM